MTREIKVGADKVVFGASGALPVLYRDLTGRDFFKDIAGASESATMSFDMAWVMYRDANPNDAVSEVDWLRRFNFMDINNAMNEIANLLTDSQTTTSTAKKKTDL